MPESLEYNIREAIENELTRVIIVMPCLLATVQSQLKTRVSIYSPLK